MKDSDGVEKLIVTNLKAKLVGKNAVHGELRPVPPPSMLSSRPRGGDIVEYLWGGAWWPYVVIHDESNSESQVTIISAQYGGQAETVKWYILRHSLRYVGGSWTPLDSVYLEPKTSAAPASSGKRGNSVPASPAPASAGKRASSGPSSSAPASAGKRGRPPSTAPESAGKRGRPAGKK